VSLRQLYVVLLSLGMAAPAVAQQPAPATPAPPDQGVVVTGELPDAQKRVCKSSAPTGSIIERRVCRTKAQWEELRRQSLAGLAKMRERAEAEEQARRSKEMRSN
jgi:hypothetical protein